MREHICSGRLRLSPAERGVGVVKTVTITVLPADDEQGLAGSPMSGQSPLALAVSDAPQLDCVVIRPTNQLPRIPWVELDAGDT